MAETGSAASGGSAPPDAPAHAGSALPQPVKATFGWKGVLAALAVLALATASLFSDLAGRDLSQYAAANVVAESRHEGRAAWDSLGADDLRFVTWQIARNARVLVSDPLSLFEMEMCFPAERAMTYGESAITLGIVGIPAWWATRDPVFTYTFVTVMISLAGAVGMFLLIREWTGVDAAGIAAGLLYAYHEVKIGDVIHPYVWDNAWTIFALYFATRLFRAGRLRDALGLSAAIALQIGGSIYPLIAAALIALPFVPWLLWRHGLARQRPMPWVLLVSAVVGFAVMILGPYFGQRAAGGLEAPTHQFFRPMEWLLPGSGGFPGIVMLALIVAAFALGRRRCLRDAIGDPRVALGIAAAVIFGLSVVGGEGTAEGVIAIARGEPSPSGLPNLYMTISRFVPGIEVGRAPGAMYTGVHLLMAALAGIGSAGVVRVVPARFALATGVALVAVAYVDTVRPASLGLAPRTRLEAFALRPADDPLAFFDRLARDGNEGPILELPMVQINLHRASLSLITAAYHQRPVAHCYNSFIPPVTGEVEALAATLPDAKSLRTLRGLGFTTVVVHHPADDPYLVRRQRKFERFEAGPHGRLLTRLLEGDTMTAYRIEAPPLERAEAPGS